MTVNTEQWIIKKGERTLLILGSPATTLMLNGNVVIFKLTIIKYDYLLKPILI